MLTYLVSALLLTGAQEGSKLVPPQVVKGDAAAKLKECCSKASSAGTYAYESTVESEGGGGGGPPGGGAGGGGAGNKRTDTTSGKVEIGKSAELKRGETLAYRLGDKLVYKKGEAWEVYVAPDFSGGFGGGAGNPPGGTGAPPGGGAGGPPGGGRGGGPGGRGSWEMMSLSTHTLPHDVLSSLDGKLKDVKSTEADGKWTFTGTLTEAGADEISGAKRFRDMAERFQAGSGSSIKSSGTATITFGKDGNAEQVVFDTKMTTQRGESTRKQTIALKDWGKTKVEVPAEAATKVAG